MMYGVRYIETKLPDGFLFENVFAITFKKHRRFFDGILRMLQAIKEPGTELQCYDVKWKVCDTQVHGGIPQARKRCYLVGNRISKSVLKFSWPKQIACKKLKSFIGPPDQEKALQTASTGGEHIYPAVKKMSTATNKRNYKSALRFIKKKGGDPFGECWAIDIFSSKAFGTHVKKDVCPCLTKARCESGGFLFSNRGKVQSTKSMLLLQGVDPPARLRRPRTVKPGKFRGMIGNAMTVSVVGRIMLRQFKALGFVDSEMEDPWESK
jgi:hypothetical protein